MGITAPFHVVKNAVKDFLEDDAMVLAAAIAFYAGLSLAPLLIIILSATLLLSDQAAQQLVDQINQQVGPKASTAVDGIVASARQQRSAGLISMAIGFGSLLISATGLFVQLQKGLNSIWEVQARAGQGLMGWLRKRISSLIIIGVIGALLLASLVVTTALGAMFRNAGWIWDVVNMAVSAGLFMLLFAAIFKWLPDVSIRWRDALWGGLVTAILFAIGKWGISLYLSRGSVGSVYGAAGSLLVLLVWVYYSSLIFFFGAEITQVIAHRSGGKIVPDEHAEWNLQARKRFAEEDKNKRKAG